MRVANDQQNTYRALVDNSSDILLVGRRQIHAPRNFTFVLGKRHLAFLKKTVERICQRRDTERQYVCVTCPVKQIQKLARKFRTNTYGNVVRQKIYDLCVRHAFERSCDNFVEVVLVALWNHEGKL